MIFGIKSITDAQIYKDNGTAKFDETKDIISVTDILYKDITLFCSDFCINADILYGFSSHGDCNLLAMQFHP